MLKNAKYLLDFYIDASVHVALAVFSLYYMFVLKHNLPYDESLAYTIFYGTIVGYNLVKYATVARVHTGKIKKSFWLIIVFSIISFLLLIYYSSNLPFRTMACLAVGLLVVLGYIFPFFSSVNLRSISRLKVFLVAFCWSLAIILAPAYHYNLKINTQIIIECFQIFVLIIALIIPFDIRDLRYDSKCLQTIPQMVGIKKAKQLTYMLMLIYTVLDVTLWGVQLYQLLILLLIIAINKMPNEPIKYYCSLGIESFPILLLYGYLIVV